MPRLPTRRRSQYRKAALADEKVGWGLKPNAASIGIARTNTTQIFAINGDKINHIYAIAGSINRRRRKAWARAAVQEKSYRPPTPALWRISHCCEKAQDSCRRIVN